MLYDIWNAETRTIHRKAVTECEAVQITQCDDIAGWVEEEGRCDVDDLIVVPAGSPQPEALDMEG